MAYWLMKSEPQVYSISHLQQEGKTLWDGVRNYQARNFLRQMQPGDLAFFYHSSVTPPGIVGLMEITTSNLDDPSQFDSQSPYFDPKSTADSPRWQTVQVEFVATFPEILTLQALKQEFKADELWVVRRGNRLSVMPISDRIGDRLLLRAGYGQKP
ncbi:MAG: EVE domain-containing protein [Chloroflexaceae bacterium]|nr:EVE domain-containing protein [Chloroflexaceae bacterium]